MHRFAIVHCYFWHLVCESNSRRIFQKERGICQNLIFPDSRTASQSVFAIGVFDLFQGCDRDLAAWKTSLAELRPRGHWLLHTAGFICFANLATPSRALFKKVRRYVLWRVFLAVAVWQIFQIAKATCLHVIIFQN